ncbi:MAG: KTSC domain-containing protein [Emticicia sp.]
MFQYTEVDSSIIDLVGYDAGTKTLEIRFIDTGFSYEYYDVPPTVYEQLLESSSKGIYLRNCIIDCYKVSDEPKRNLFKPFVGEYTITEMPDFDDTYLNMDGDPTIIINDNGSGEFHFGVITGHFEGKVKEKNDKEVFSFRWTGNDEADDAAGTGWILIDDENEAIEGEICFEDGDEHYFFAYKK